MVPPRPTRFAWYLLSRTITRCTSASGTLLARAWLATMLSYCARLCAIASGGINSAAMAGSANFGKLFIKTNLGGWAFQRRVFWLVPLPGADVAKSRRHRGEMFVAGARVNGQARARRPNCWLHA